MAATKQRGARHRRSSNKRTRTTLPAGIVGVAAVVASVSFLAKNPMLVVALGIVILGLVASRIAWHVQGQHRLQRRLDLMLSTHERALLACYRQSIHNDAFGNRVEGPWQGHIDTFLRTKVVSDKVDYKSWRQTGAGRQLADRVDSFAKEKAAQFVVTEPQSTVSVMELTPGEYERYCADALRRRGWAVQITPATRDGGADFVAEKLGQRIVVQCKRYAKSVGNGAVQEVNAAVRLYAGTLACVVAPNGFTPQARREAFGLGVYLLDHLGLQELADKIEREQAALADP